MSFTIQKKGSSFTIVDTQTEESVGEFPTRRDAVKNLRMRLGFEKKSPREQMEKDKDEAAEKKKAKEVEDAKEISGIKKAEEEDES